MTKIVMVKVETLAEARKLYGIYSVNKDKKQAKQFLDAIEAADQRRAI